MKDLISQETTERVKRDNCFDFLRYFFAFSLILVHFCTLTNQEQFWFITGQIHNSNLGRYIMVYDREAYAQTKNYLTQR